MKNPTSLNGIVRVVFAGLLGLSGLGLIVYGSIKSDPMLISLAGGMVAGSGLTAWDARV